MSVITFSNVFQVPTINQENGIAGSEPSETLKEFRSDKVLRPNKKQQGKVRDLVPKRFHLIIHVNDTQTNMLNDFAGLLWTEFSM